MEHFVIQSTHAIVDVKTYVMNIWFSLMLKRHLLLMWGCEATTACCCKLAKHKSSRNGWSSCCVLPLLLLLYLHQSCSAARQVTGPGMAQDAHSRQQHKSAGPCWLVLQRALEAQDMLAELKRHWSEANAESTFQHSGSPGESGKEMHICRGKLCSFYMMKQLWFLIPAE